MYCTYTVRTYTHQLYFTAEALNKTLNNIPLSTACPCFWARSIF